MERAEAIHRLKNTAWLGTNKDREETEQAVDMAIEALSADTVSREEYNDLLRTKISFANATIPTFAESAEAYKAWTGEEMGGDAINEMNKEIIKDILKMMPTTYLLEALGVSTFEELTEQADRPHGRLIDADALYKKATDLWNKSDSEDFEKGIFKLILNAPTVSAERPHGVWKHNKAYSSMEFCSECGMPFLHEDKYPRDYCPNCGAYMGGDGE